MFTHSTPAAGSGGRYADLRLGGCLLSQSQDRLFCAVAEHKFYIDARFHRSLKKEGEMNAGRVATTGIILDSPKTSAAVLA